MCGVHGGIRKMSEGEGMRGKRVGEQERTNSSISLFPDIAVLIVATPRLAVYVSHFLWCAMLWRGGKIQTLLGGALSLLLITKV
jgi:hypothetical protein